MRSWRRFSFALDLALLPIVGALSMHAAGPRAGVQSPVMSGPPAPASCPVTRPPDPPFVAPPPYPAAPPAANHVWFGSVALWVMLPADGVWRNFRNDRPDGPFYPYKLFWWRAGYYAPVDPVPALRVTGRRLDDKATSFALGHATNAHSPDFGGWTMLMMPDIRSGGCWEITGRYAGDTLTFVVWVAP